MASTDDSLLTDSQSRGPNLTIKEIAPRWPGRIKDMPLPLFSLKGPRWGLQMIFAETCIVGEAYGHSAPYIENCAICRDIGYEFVTSFMTRSHGRFQRNLDAFVDHCNERHAYITLRKKRAKFNLGKLFKVSEVFAPTA